MKISTRELVLAGLLSAMSVILSFPVFKVMGSIGFDAIPAFFGASLISPVMGGLIGGIAHIVSAMLTGFPFSLPVHLGVMMMMFVTCWSYGVARHKINRYAAVAVGITMNGPVTLLVAALIAKAIGAEFAGMVMFTALIGPLTLVSAINVVLADMLVGLVGSRFQKSFEV